MCMYIDLYMYIYTHMYTGIYICTHGNISHVYTHMHLFTFLLAIPPTPRISRLLLQKWKLTQGYIHKQMHTYTHMHSRTWSAFSAEMRQCPHFWFWNRQTLQYNHNLVLRALPNVNWLGDMLSQKSEIVRVGLLEKYFHHPRTHRRHTGET